jgi:hypothetical protein
MFPGEYQDLGFSSGFHQAANENELIMNNPYPTNGVPLNDSV